MVLTTTLGIAIVALAVAVQDVTAFGFGLVATPLLLNISGPYTVNTVLQLTIVTMTWTLCSIWLRRHREVPLTRGAANTGADSGSRSTSRPPSPRHTLYMATAISIVGIACGHVLVEAISVTTVKLVVGVFVVCAAIAALFGIRLKQSKTTLAFAGFVGGVLTPITATPGPPVVLVYHELEPDRRQAQLSMYFLTGAVVSSALFTRWDIQTFEPAIPLIIGIALGKLVSPVITRAITANTAHILAILLCAVSGTSLVISALLK